MKTKLLALILVAGGSLFAETHFSVGVNLGGPGYYGPPRVAVAAYRPPCPGPGYAWVDGYRDGYGNWSDGYWAAPRYYGGGYYNGYWGGERGYNRGGYGFRESREHEWRERERREHERREHEYREHEYREHNRGYDHRGDYGQGYRH
jgi:hypothetical protein